MAVVANFNDDDENKPKQQSNSAGSIVTGGAGGAGGGKNPSTVASPGGYTNLSNYLSLNQNQGATTGQAAANLVKQSGAQADQAVKAYGDTAKSTIDAATKKAGVDQKVLGSISQGSALDQKVLDQINSGVSAYNPVGSDLSKYSSSGVPTVGTIELPTGKGDGSPTLEQLINKAKNVTGEYSGPTTFGDLTAYKGPSSVASNWGGPNSTGEFTGDALKSQISALGARDLALSNAQAAGSGFNGARQLLGQAYAQPGYTSGEKGLDAFLATGSPGGRNALSSVKGVGDSAAQSYSKLNEMLSQDIQTGKDTAKATGKTYSDAIEKAKTDSAKARETYESAANAAREKSAANKKTADSDLERLLAEMGARHPGKETPIGTSNLMPGGPLKESGFVFVPQAGYGDNVASLGKDPYDTGFLSGREVRSAQPAAAKAKQSAVEPTLVPGNKSFETNPLISRLKVPTEEERPWWL